MSDSKATIKVKGMFCTSCERRVRNALISLPGVKDADASFDLEEVSVVYDASLQDIRTFEQTISDLGYEIERGSDRTIHIVSILIIILAIYVIARHMGWTQVFNIFPSIGTSVSMGMLFVIGLLTSVHCIAMCGGINLSQSVITVRNDRNVLADNIAYNAGRVISYTAVGAIAGSLGSVLSISGSVKGIIAVIAGAIMIIMALRMLGVFRPLVRRFRKSSIHLPDGFYTGVLKLFRRRSSLLIGLLNGLMPCGPLQSMQIYALSTASAAMGALSMFLFSLGTVPLMLGLGMVSGKLNNKYTKYMLTVSAVLIFVMGMHMMSNGFTLSGVSVSEALRSTSAERTAVLDGDIQRVTSNVDYGSYDPIVVHIGIPVEWNLNVPSGKLNGCNGEINIPQLEMTISLREGDNLIEFTPDKTGTFPYSCWMGMIKSHITVID